MQTPRRRSNWRSKPRTEVLTRASPKGWTSRRRSSPSVSRPRTEKRGWPRSAKSASRTSKANDQKGLYLDLKSPSAQQVLERLVKWADVLIVNTPHPARKRLKLEYDDVVAWNPRLIYADVTGFGEKGPDAELPGFDITAYWARSGLLS